jgi:TonB-linked SusC/RagA family outer membrane protein
MRKGLLVGLACLLIAASAFAQKVVTGRVTDEKGDPIQGASVTIKGTKVGAVTSVDGSYRVELPANGKMLVYSYVGYQTAEVAVGTQSNIVVNLRPGQSNLDEVVVVAYGNIKKGDFTGSASQITSKEFEKRPITNVLNAIPAAAPGIQTTATNGSPGSSPGIRIRGFGSVNASNSPLYVVDNVPYDGGIANLNPEDVESVTVLKDASTTALYGSRAANGVIMITTKRGKKNRSSLNFRYNQGVSTRGLQEYDRVDAFEYYPLMWESYRNTLANAATPQPLPTANLNATNGIKGLLGYNPFTVADNNIVGTDGQINVDARLKWADDLDWTKEIVRMGERKDASLSFSGGTDKSDYFGSFGYTDERGFIIRSDWRRFSGRLNVNTQPTKWFKVGLNLSGAFNNSNQASDGSSTGLVNPFYFTRAMGPIYPVYLHDQTTGAYILDAQGNKIYDFGNGQLPGMPFRTQLPGRHNVAETRWNQDKFTRNTLSARNYADIIFAPWLKFTTNIAVDITDYMGSSYQNQIVGDGAPAGRASKEAYKSRTFTFNQLLQFNKKWDVHNVTALVAHENYDYNYSSLYGFRQGQAVEGNIELTNFATINSLTSAMDNARIESYFGRLNYDYDGRFYATASYRRDGNSKFSPAVRWSSFWGLGGGWRLDREKFIASQNWINLLKLRSSYGQVGNEGGISLYAYQALYGVSNNAAEPGFRQSTLPSPDLTWETSKNFDVAVDFALFKNRLSGTIEWYDRVTDRMIFDVATTISNGQYSISQNIGSMYNKGIEVELKYDVIRTNDFTWNLGINATTLRNRITKMPPTNKEIISGTKKLAEGRSIYDYWLREWMGVNPDNGEALYRAASWVPANSFINSKGDTVTNSINNARFIYTGTAIPDLFGGINTSFRYKNFDLSLLFNYQLGGKIYDAAYASLMHAGTYGAALHRDALLRWRKPGDVTNVPRMEQAKTGVYDAGSSRWLIDGDFVQLRTVSLSYDLGKVGLKRITANSMSVYLSGENIFMLSRRQGMNVNQEFSGVTSNVYTPARIVTAGLSINF